MRIRLVVLSAAVLALTGAGVAAAGDGGTKLPAAGTKAGTDTLGSYARVAGPTYRLPPYGFGQSTAVCPAGMVLLGGGETNSAAGTMVLTDSYPTGANSWTAYVKNTANDIQSFTAWAICGS